MTPAITPKQRGRWKKGESGNPSGRPKTPEDILKMKDTFRIKFEETILKLLECNQGQLHKIHTSPDSKAHELIVARFLQMAINFGDVQRFTLLCDRFIGAQPKAIIAQVLPEGAEVTPRLLEEQRNKLLAIMLQLKDQPDEAPCKLIPTQQAVQSQSLVPSSQVQSDTESCEPN